VVHTGIGTVEHEKAVIHYSEPYIDLGIALIPKFILE
jgi:hypothetical protein